MMILDSKNTPQNTKINNGIHISKEYLKYVVESISIPRHFIAESGNNIFVAKWIKNEFEKLGMKTSYQGKYRNIVATSESTTNKCTILLGGHYDSVPNSAGADDNALFL